ncbi:hypothetical protein A5320_12250 [Rheinheimera sp. SA_1]|uniref:ice-binding family protein n=1 Tax=Rheinheimera sp. SA_1 TaxID=1827365 RepID=UPI0007FC987D|nr:ice-binding family protein [Rheinheimera sp. SA_1]OBP14531.1 hypothetical protein A5320_12250 [Rheinheimera sp. SA_1]
MNHLRPKTYANKLSWCLGVVMTLLLAGCNSDDKDPILTPDSLTGLTQIVVNPANPNIPAGLSRQFEALGVYADGTSVNISNRVTWNSATTMVATVNATGMVSALTNGTSVISAAVAGKTGQTTLTVTDAALVSITLTPLASTANAGVDVQFGATGVYSNGSSQNLTSAVIWTSSDLTIASFNPDRLPNSGLARALAAGTTTVTANLAGISANTTFTVTAASLTSLVITPANPSVIVGLNQQMVVTGTFSGGNSVDLTSQAVWASVDTSLLTFNTNGAANSGLATAIAPGTAAITASFGGMTATSNVLVNSAELTALSITPITATIAAGNSQQFIATGIYNNGTSENITSIVTWSSSDISIAYVNPNMAIDSGLATTLIPGNVMISATIDSTMGTISNSAPLTVTDAIITTVTISPTTPQLINGFTQQLKATANYSNQTTVDVTTTVSWSSSDTTVVTMNPSGVSNSGLATPVMVGTALITATLNAMTSASAQVSVVDATLTNISVTPLLPGLAAGNSQQFSASGIFSNGSMMDLSRFVTWQSANTVVATFNPNFQNNSGLLTSFVIGNTEVTASLNGVQSSTNLTVTSATLVSVALTPATPTMSSGQTLQMQLIGTYTDNSVADLTTVAAWSSNNTSVATVNPNLQPDSGLISALVAGSSMIHAEVTLDNLERVSSSTLLTVTGTLAVNPEAPQLNTVAGFVVAARQGIATTPGSTLSSGDMAILDVNRAGITGFTTGANAGEFTELTDGISYAPDDTNPPYLVPAPYATSAAYIAQLKSDVMDVANYLAEETNPAANVTLLNNNELGGVTLNRGVYHISGNGMISQSDLSIDGQGDANSVFIFYISGSFNVAALSNIVLLNGAKASNVYWRISGNTTIGTNSQFVGNVFSWLTIQLATGASVNGRLFSVNGNILLDANSVTKPL